MNDHLQRARLLAQQARWDNVEQHLMQHLGVFPNDDEAHALLAIALQETKRPKEALLSARHAVSLAPDQLYPLYVLGSVLYQQNKYKEAMPVLDDALRLDAADPDVHSLIGAVHVAKKRWGKALEHLETALVVDPEHVEANNLRAIALVHSRQMEEADLTLEATLQRNPQNATTHANQGWNLLHQGEHKKALEHFKESLRLEPNNEWARQGVIHALQAQNIVYRLLLKYFLWMSRFSGAVQFAIIIGFFIGYRIMVGMTKGSPALQQTIIIVYVAIVVLTWGANPFFNLVLRLHPYGKLVLNERERFVSSLNAGVLIVGLLCVVAGFVLGQILPWMFAALGAACLIIPIYTASLCTRKANLMILTGVCLLFAILGLGGIIGLLGLAPTLSMGYYYFIGLAIFSWVGMALVK